jgi:hypothetical protein
MVLSVTECTGVVFSQVVSYVTIVIAVYKMVAYEMVAYEMIRPMKWLVMIWLAMS